MGTCFVKDAIVYNHNDILPKQTWFLFLMFLIGLPGGMVQSASQPTEVTEMYGKMASYLESRGFTIKVPPVEHYPTFLEGIIDEAEEQGSLRARVWKSTYRNHSVKDYLDAQDSSKYRVIENPQKGDVWHDYQAIGGYHNDAKVTIRIVQIQDRQLVIKNHLEEFIRTQATLSQQADSEGLPLNVRQSPNYTVIHQKEREDRNNTDGWWPIPDFHQGTKALIAAQAEQDFCLWGESRSDEMQYDQGIALLGGGHLAKKDQSYVESLQMRVMTDHLAMEVNLKTSAGGWNSLRNRVTKELPALSIMGDLYTQFTGKPFPYRLEQQPVATLSITSGTSQLMADGKSKTSLILVVIRQQGSPVDLPIRLKISSNMGQVLGELSEVQVITDESGIAQVEYTAPSAADWGDVESQRVEIQADCEPLGLRDTLYLDLVTQQPAHMAAQHQILPAHPDYPNRLTFTFDTPDKAWGKSFQAEASCSSQHGRLRLGTNPTGSRSLVLKEAISGSENTIYYEWAGPQLDAPIDEVLTLNIPDLQLECSVTFSVGMDLILDAVPLAWKGPFYPGLALPIKAMIKDRYHPEADLGQLLEDFEIEPVLTLEQTSYSPIAVGSVRDDRFLQNFIKGVTGATMPHGSLVHGVYSGTVKQTPEGWLLIDRFESGLAELPRVTCHDMGSYLFTATLDPRFKGDATEQLHEASIQISIEQIPPDEEQFFTFLLPTMQAYLALYPGAESLGDLVEISAMAHEGKLKQALQDMGREFLLERVKDAATEYAKKKLGPAGDYLMEELEKRVSPTTYARLKKAMQETSDTLDNEDVEEVMDWLNLDVDVVGHVVGACVDSGADHFEGRLGSLQTFLKGADTCGALVVVHDDQTEVKAMDASGAPWQPADPQLFANRRHQRLYQGQQGTVIPFVKGETFELGLQGQGSAPVRIYKILGDGTLGGQLDYQGQAWEKTLTIDGRSVKP